MKIITTLLAIAILIATFQLGYAQETYKIHSNQDVAIKLKGTSTFHDWEMEAKNATGEAQFIFDKESENELSALKSLSFALKVEDLKSDNKGLDKNAYEALKTDEFKNIYYKLSSSSLFIEESGYVLKSEGNLTVAGVTKKILMDVHIAVNEDGTITCKGTYKLKMTDYGVEPPTFMMGIMKTGDALTLDFTILYKK